jgi:thioredoxin-related protein
MKMLPDTGGLNYYLTNEQWEIIREKCKIGGIPTYMFFDKTGKKVFETTGYPGNDNILKELAKVW